MLVETTVVTPRLAFTRRVAPLAAAGALGGLAVVAILLSRMYMRCEYQLAAFAADWMKALAVIAVGAWTAGRTIAVVRNTTRHPFSSLEIALVAWILCACIAALWPVNARWWTYALLPYLSFGLVFVLARSLVDHVAVRWVVAIAGAIVVVSVLLDAFGLLVWWTTRRPGGVLCNRNFAGEYIALALPAALVAFTRNRRGLIVLVLFGLALALTRCRTAWIVVVLAAPAIVALSPVPARKLRVFGAAAVLVGALLAAAIPTNLEWTEESPYSATLSRTLNLKTGSGAIRLMQHEVTLRTLDARDALWTGFGAGRWQAEVQVVDRRAARNRIPHSDYLRTLADAGIPALVALWAMLGAAGLIAWRRRADSPDGFVFVAVLAVTAVADSPLFRTEVVVIAAAVLGTLQARAPMARGISGLEPARATTT